MSDFLHLYGLLQKQSSVICELPPLMKMADVWTTTTNLKISFYQQREETNIFVYVDVILKMDLGSLLLLLTEEHNKLQLYHKQEETKNRDFPDFFFPILPLLWVFLHLWVWHNILEAALCWHLVSFPPQREWRDEAAKPSLLMKPVCSSASDYHIYEV